MAGNWEYPPIPTYPGLRASGGSGSSSLFGREDTQVHQDVELRRRQKAQGVKSSRQNGNTFVESVAPYRGNCQVLFL